MREDAIALIAGRLELSEEQAEQVLLLTHWVDAELAQAHFGYPKDNVIPPPLEERLEDAAYLSALRDAAEDGGEHPLLVGALDAYLRRTSEDPESSL